jgi:hypothetical protein
MGLSIAEEKHCAGANPFNSGTAFVESGCAMLLASLVRDEKATVGGVRDQRRVSIEDAILRWCEGEGEVACRSGTDRHSAGDCGGADDEMRIGGGEGSGEPDRRRPKLLTLCMMIGEVWRTRIVPKEIVEFG